MAALRSLATALRDDGVLRPGRLLGQDCRNLRGRWSSDWTLHRLGAVTVPAVLFVYLISILPGIAFASDLEALTNRNWGTIEVLLSTGVAQVVFSVWVHTPSAAAGC